MLRFKKKPSRLKLKVCIKWQTKIHPFKLFEGAISLFEKNDKTS